MELIGLTRLALPEVFAAQVHGPTKRVRCLTSECPSYLADSNIGVITQNGHPYTHVYYFLSKIKPRTAPE